MRNQLEISDCRADGNAKRSTIDKSAVELMIHIESQRHGN